MALIRLWNADRHSLAAIWKIEEPESFFRERLNHLEFPEISLERRRLERWAGRYLLRQLRADFPLGDIAADEEDKPRIQGNPLYFSISHSWPYVGVILNSQSEVGIDIQCWHPRIDRLQHKFLSPEEQCLVGPRATKRLHLAWSVKEAAYKWAGSRGLRFAEDILIRDIREKPDSYAIRVDLIRSGIKHRLFVEGRLEADYSLAYVVYP